MGQLEDAVREQERRGRGSQDIPQPRQVQAPSGRDTIIAHIKSAVQQLAHAQGIAMQANPMTADVAVFQRMAAMQKELGGMMLEVSKLRGLE